MAKLVILAAVLALFIFVDNISAYRTTVTTVEIEDGEVVPKGKQKQSESESAKCRKELQQVQLNPCEIHVFKRVQEGMLSLRGVYTAEMEQRCCEELKKISGEQCQCDALQQVAQMLGGRIQGKQQMQRMESELKNLPERCGMQSMSHCDVRSSSASDF